MSEKVEAVTVEFKIENGQSVLKIRELENEVERSGRSMQRHVDQLKGAFSAFGGVLAGVGLGFGAYELFGFLTDSVKEAAEAERGVRSFEIAARNMGLQVATASKRAQDFASHLASVTTYGDDAVLSTQQLLMSLGGLTGDGLERATKAAADLAAGMGIGLNEAAMKLAKAAAGSTDGLREVGIQAKTLEEALGSVERAYGGMAEAVTETSAGALLQLANEFGELKEAIGGTLEGIGVVSLLRDMTAQLRELNKAIAESDPRKLAELLSPFYIPGARDVQARFRAQYGQMPTLPGAAGPDLAGGYSGWRPEYLYSAPYTPASGGGGAARDPWSMFRPFSGGGAAGYGPGGDAVGAAGALRTINVELQHFLGITNQLAAGQVDAGIRAFYSAAQPLAAMLGAELNPQLVEMRDALGYSEDATGADGAVGDAGPMQRFAFLSAIGAIPDVAAKATSALAPLNEGVNMIAQGFAQAGAAFLDAAIHGESTAGIFSGIARQLGRSAMAQGLYELALGTAALTPWGRALYGKPENHFMAAAYFGAAGAALSVLSGGGGGSSVGGGGGSYGSSAGTGSKYGSGYARAVGVDAPAPMPAYHMTVIVQGSVVSQQEIATIVDEQWRRLTGRRGK